MTKSKWYFVVPVLVLLLVDQSFKKDFAYKQKQSEKSLDKTIDNYEKNVKLISNIINITIITLILIGTMHYYVLQKTQYKNNFSISKFFFGVTICAKEMPDYNKFLTVPLTQKFSQKH